MTKTIPKLADMFAELVATPSVSCADPAIDMGNRPIAERYAQWLEALGFACEFVPLPGNPDKLNLVATLGHGDDGLVLAGHLDTVPYDAALWTNDPFTLTERDGRYYGLGTSDMKGFLAIAADAAREYADRTLKQPLILLASADEECGMDGAKALAAAGKPRARHAVIGEPTNLRPIRAHKGIFMETVRVLGRAGHSSDPRHGLNAIEGMHTVLDALLGFRQELREQYRDEIFPVPHPTLNPGVLRGGDSPNRIPASCELQLDLRFLPGADMDALRQALHERARDALAGTDYRLEFDTLFEGTPAMDTPVTADIVTAAAELTGSEPAAVDFGTEGAYYNGMGMDTVILGPGDIAQAHKADEYLAMDRIQPMRDILCRLIGRFCL